MMFRSAAVHTYPDGARPRVRVRPRVRGRGRARVRVRVGVRVRVRVMVMVRVRVRPRVRVRVRADLPSEARAYRVVVVSPAEDTLVRTGETRRGLHALVRDDAVEGVLVAAAPAAQHRLRPAAQLHTAV